MDKGLAYTVLTGALLFGTVVMAPKGKTDSGLTFEGAEYASEVQKEKRAYKPGPELPELTTTTSYGELRTGPRIARKGEQVTERTAYRDFNGDGLADLITWQIKDPTTGVWEKYHFPQGDKW